MAKKLPILFMLVFLAESAFGWAVIDLDSSLVGWYRGEDNANDSSSLGNDATFAGSYVAGKFGKGFTGATLSIPGERGGPINFTKNESFTWSVWLNLNETGTHKIISFDDYYKLEWFSTTRWNYRLGVDSTSFREGYVVDTDVIGNWRHVALSYNADTEVSTIYLNGGSPQARSTAAYPDWKDPGNMHVWATKQIVDELLIFNRVLSDEEIAGIYNASADSLINIGGNDYYVATDGSDSDSGGIDDPFLTIQKFADIAIHGDTCWVREGTYRETITPANSGNAESLITYKAYPGETVVVSGADVLSGEWTVHCCSIYKGESTTDLGLGFNQVFVNGDAMIWARYPNADKYSAIVEDYAQHLSETLEVTSGSWSGTGATAGCIELTEPNAYWEGAVFHGIWSPRYGSYTGIVDSYTVGVLNMTLDYKGYGSSSFRDSAFYLTNKLEAIDVAGEWFLNTDTDTMYLRTLDSDDPAGSVVEVKARQTAFDLNDISYTVIENLSIFAADILTNPFSSYNTFNNLDIKYVSHYTVLDSNPASYGIRNSGIILDGDYNTLQNSTINFSAGNGVAMPGDNCNVLRTNIYNVNYGITQCSSVHLGKAGHYWPGHDNTISHCVIANAGRGCIEHSNSENLTLTHNDMSGTRSTGWTWDLGATYAHGTDGKRSIIAYNIIHDCRSFGIYLDNRNWNFDIYYNVVYDLSWTSNIPEAIHMNQESQYHTIHNNTFYDGYITTQKVGAGLYSMKGTTISNNIVRGFRTVGSAKFTGHTDPTDDATLTRNIIIE